MFASAPASATPLETIYNPVTGDRAEVLRSALTDGGETVLRFTVPADSPAAPPPHYHREMTETFVIESGQLGIHHNGRKRVLTPGEAVTVRPGETHRFWNPGPDPVTFHVIATPGANFERFIRGMYAAAQAGETNRAGLPRNPSRIVGLLFLGDIWIPGVPAWLQTALRNWLQSHGRVSVASPSAPLSDPAPPRAGNTQ